MTTSAQIQDIEDVLDVIESLLKAQLNTEIARVEGDKANRGKGVKLMPIDEDAYFQQSFSDRMLSKSPAIFYGAADIGDAVSADAATAVTYKIFIEAVVVDNGMDAFTWRRVNRYARAIKQLVEKNFAAFPAGGRIKVKTVEPAGFRLSVDSSDVIKVGGVLVTVTLF